MNQNKTKALSFFVPFFNEEKELAATVSSIRSAAGAALSSYEILLIDDGSTDGSSRIAAGLAAAHEEVRLIRFEKNLSFGEAYATGLRAARLGHAMYLSADGDVRESELRSLLGSWDGSRALVQYAANPKARIFSRYLLSLCFTRLVNALSGRNWPYYNGFNIYSLERLRRMKTRNFGFATQAYAVLTLCEAADTQLLSLESRFSDETSKALTWRNFVKAASFFAFILGERLAPSQK